MADLLDGLDGSFGANLRRLIADAPGRVSITSGRRSTAQQAALYKAKPDLAAPPGRSRHETGLAADLAFQDKATQVWVHANAHRYGLRFPMLNPKGKKYEPWHVEPIGSAARSMSAAVRQANDVEETGATTQVNEYEEDRYDIGVQLSALLGIVEDPLADELEALGTRAA